MTSMTTLGTRHRGSWTRQTTDGASNGDFVAIDAPGPADRLVTRVTRGRQLGGKHERLTIGGETLDQLRPRLVHLPAVQ